LNVSRKARLLILSCAAAALGVGPAAVRADFYDPSVSFGSAADPLPLNFGPSSPNPLLPLLLPQFDPSKGTLQEVILTLDATLEGNYSVHNTADGAETFGVFSFGKVTLLAPAGQSLVVPLQVRIPAVTLQGHTTIDNVHLSASPGPQMLLIPQADFAAFQGTGTFSVNVAGVGDPQAITVNGLSFPATTPSSIVAYNGHDGGTVSQEGYGTVTVNYRFAPLPTNTPEPAGIVLMASGVGLALLARWRGARAKAAHGSRG